jgi:hypothetical protein
MARREVVQTLFRLYPIKVFAQRAERETQLEKLRLEEFVDRLVRKPCKLRHGFDTDIVHAAFDFGDM